ncbi:hypothetical protein Hypma_007932 [Hypsizygus marmoreus]|uniref:Uncharacterized protein n=1 Tax=Hypsizygus marmoreus TaxID=39966 RepID=A0A369JXP8_HYPMA|nr:hypothetical protein Hypma_007932 [Hypsizygus marmoreus]
MTPNQATFWSSRASGREKPKKPSIIIPPTPINACRDSFSQPQKILPSLQYSVSSTACVTPISPTSLSPLSPESHLMEDTIAEGTASSDVIVIAELFATLKRTATALNTTFHRLEKQTEKMAGLAPAMKAAEQMRDVRAKLEQQIARHDTTMREVRSLLESTVKASLIQRLKSQIYTAIRETVATEIDQRVEQELLKQIPQKLRQQGQVHQRQVLEIKTSIHNSEARHHNASLWSPSLTEPLRPLLRPLPSAAQSPAYVVRGPFPPTSSTIATPMSAFPMVPTSTPLVAAPALMMPRGSSQIFELVPPTPSPLFPRDLKSLFALGPDAAKRLLQDYGIDHGQSPSSQESHPKAPPRGLTDSAIDLSPIVSPLDAADSREQDINHFMAHIGVRPIPYGAPSKTERRPHLHVVIPGGPTFAVANYY